MHHKVFRILYLSMRHNCFLVPAFAHFSICPCHMRHLHTKLMDHTWSWPVTIHQTEQVFRLLQRCRWDLRSTSTWRRISGWLAPDDLQGALPQEGKPKQKRSEMSAHGNNTVTFPLENSATCNNSAVEKNKHNDFHSYLQLLFPSLSLEELRGGLLSRSATNAG